MSARTRASAEDDRAMRRTKNLLIRQGEPTGGILPFFFTLRSPNSSQRKQSVKRARLAKIRRGGSNAQRAGRAGGPRGRSLLDERAGRVGELAESLVALHRLDELVVIPGPFRLRGRLDLHDVHVVLHQAVGADHPVAVSYTHLRAH